jgi:hypothetical protein
MNTERLRMYLSDKYIVGLTGLILVLIAIWICVVFTVDDSAYKYIFDVADGFIVGFCAMNLLDRINKL